MRSIRCIAIGICLIGLSIPTEVPAQLSPAQVELINQLPPSQREAAMRQLNQMRTATTTTPGAAVAAASAPVAVVTDATEDVTEIRGGSTMVISVTGGAENIDAGIIEGIRNGNPFVVNELGEVEVPGVGAIALAGLTAQQAKIRLQSEPALRELTLNVNLLPLSPTGVESLRPFGYSLFTGERAVQRGDLSLPVPTNYTIGPGDAIRVQLFGNRNASYEMVVERDGSIRFPELGPLTVAGMSFGQLREYIAQRVSEQMIGTQVSISLGNLRSVQVFLVGDVNEPGSYTVGALSTITTVLSQGGGVAEQGTLRAVELKRNGKRVGVLDVYDLLLRGNSSGDLRVQAGDVVFVPPVGRRVTVAGDVKRPAIYEYKGAASVADVIGLAGGLTNEAYVGGIRIQRKDPATGVVTINIDLADATSRSTKVQDGDKIFIPGGLDRQRGSVSLVGNVERAGAYQWREGLRLSDVVPDESHIVPGSDLSYVLIRRQVSGQGAPIFLSANLRAAWQMRGTAVDLELQPQDSVHVFDMDAGRTQFLGPLIEELRRQTDADNPLQIVSIGGSVNASGPYPLERGMRVADLIRAGGGLAESAYLDEAELTRYSIVGGTRSATIVPIDLRAALGGDQTANVLLQSADILTIREVPNWRANEFVELVGEVRFPGNYPIKRGETLSSVIRRAGGLTDLAYSRGSVFTRNELRNRERAQIEQLANRVERDLAGLALSDPMQAEAIGTGQALLSQLRSTDPVGRLVINLDEAISGDPMSDLVVRDGDVLRIPQRPQSVTVIGEVQYATSHVFDPKLDRNAYIDRSGGTTVKADKRRIYVVRANGEVLVGNSSRFFSSSRGVEIMPGDTIVVPLDTDRTRPLTLWTGVTQVLYQAAIAVAAVRSFDN